MAYGLYPPITSELYATFCLSLNLMSDDPKQPLLEWNRLARENTENAMVSSMLEGALRASEPIESLTTWLLVGTAAVASFFVSNADKLIPVITKSGFITCGAFLCISCMFGLLSKFFALQCKIGNETGLAVKENFAGHLAKYEEEERKIQEGAKFWGINIETGIRIERVLKEFLAPFPIWVKWLTMRTLNRHSSNPQVGYLLRIKAFNAQGAAAFVQALCFIGFLGAGFLNAAAI